MQFDASEIISNAWIRFGAQLNGRDLLHAGSQKQKQKPNEAMCTASSHVKKNILRSSARFSFKLS